MMALLVIKISGCMQSWPRHRERSSGCSTIWVVSFFQTPLYTHTVTNTTTRGPYALTNNAVLLVYNHKTPGARNKSLVLGKKYNYREPVCSVYSYF